MGICFLTLAAYATYEPFSDLIHQCAPQPSSGGIALASVSLLVMPTLSRAKKKVGIELRSAAMAADAWQTDSCVCLSGHLLAGLLPNSALEWWFADRVEALTIIPIIVKEGFDGLRGKACGETCH